MAGKTARQTLNSEQVSTLFAKIKRALRGYRIVERPMSRYYGVLSQVVIFIDKNTPASTKVKTLLHEGVHIILPEFSERNVDRLTIWMLRHLSVEEFAQLCRLYLRMRG